MIRCCALLVTLLAVLQICTGKVVEETLNITWRRTSPDGYSRRVIVINGNSPGPTIKCVLGDVLQITVQNNINLPVAIHWHGILQIGSNNMDGVPGLTQKMIAPKTTFLYKFKPNAPGTFWYHSHFHTEYVDGLRGALIVLDPKAPSFKRDNVVMLSDWYETESETLLKTVVLKKGGTGIEPPPTGGLVNGLGQRLGTACSLGCGFSCLTKATPNCPACKPKEKARMCLFKQVQAQPGGSCAKPLTKLRFIAGSGYVGFQVSIDEHLLVLVSVDLMPIKPVTVGTLYINVGQRYEVLVCRKTNPMSTSSAWIRVKMEALNPTTKLANREFLAILAYTAPTANVTGLPTTKPDPVLFATNVARVYPQVPATVDPLRRLDLDPRGLVLATPKPPPAATKRMDYMLGFMPDMNTSIMYATVNGLAFTADLSGVPVISMIKPSVPFKAKIPGLHMDFIKKGEVVDFFVKNVDYRVHPMHMHGYDVWVMARGKTLELPTLKGYPKLEANPIMRDTVSVMPQSYAILRIKADNPGLWLMHCHVEWHIAAGMVNAYHVY